MSGILTPYLPYLRMRHEYYCAITYQYLLSTYYAAGVVLNIYMSNLV